MQKATQNLSGAGKRARTTEYSAYVDEIMWNKKEGKGDYRVFCICLMKLCGIKKM